MTAAPPPDRVSRQADILGRAMAGLADRAARATAETAAADDVAAGRRAASTEFGAMMRDQLADRGGRSEAIDRLQTDMANRGDNR